MKSIMSQMFTVLSWVLFIPLGIIASLIFMTVSRFILDWMSSGIDRFYIVELAESYIQVLVSVLIFGIVSFKAAPNKGRSVHTLILFVAFLFGATIVYAIGRELLPLIDFKTFSIYDNALLILLLIAKIPGALTGTKMIRDKDFLEILSK